MSCTSCALSLDAFTQAVSKSTSNAQALASTHWLCDLKLLFVPAGRCDLYDRPAVPPPVPGRAELLLIPSILARVADIGDGVPESTGGRGPVPAWVPDNRRPVYKTELCRFHEWVRCGGAWAASHVCKRLLAQCCQQCLRVCIVVKCCLLALSRSVLLSPSNQQGNCRSGNRCTFAHGAGELRERARGRRRGYYSDSDDDFDLRYDSDDYD